MNARELRIGNIIKDDRKARDWRYATARIIADLASNPNDGLFHPVPLTEEWLFKLDLPEDGSTLELCGGYDLWFERIGDKLFLKTETSEKHIEHVHTAQNIYFAIRGEELIIKE